MRPLTLAAAFLLALPAAAQTGCAPDTTASPEAAAEEAPGEAAPVDAMKTRRVRVPLGDGEVEVHVHSRPGGALDALVLHDNENTGVEAALDVIRGAGGRVADLVHTGERNLVFRLAGRTYTADPNRVFTDAGRARTLAALSRDTPEARGALAALADSVLAVYAETDPAVVVTLHNNTEGRYSALSYASGGDYEADAEAVTVHDGSDPDDFFFVTERAHYDALVARGFNAVLQDNASATDDGSLSVWAAQNGRPYVNVEAQHGHRGMQEKMIRALAEVIAE